MKVFVILGSINMALAVAIGAFGAHGLAPRVTDKMLQTWETGAHYHIIHALALIAVGLLMSKAGQASSLMSIGGWLLFAGIVIFSGSLYTLVLTNVSKFGMITPIGGVCFIIGWILVAIATAKMAIE
ncbi:DUF423 domain-containing protein [Thermoactinomyces intermedius]|jgi:uncharacterized membrane protein YgdD (TMEM256/DUF423 family)|uniref:DUF423 domain-containing protein n=1 Tax=Thermoactinomyces intermedius TaxID=2024 RepID=A0A8I1A329_THEIN|nr:MULTISPECIES: DUF423 domain-containing protein [Thermoactinomyces]MBA4547870.1 DUF423 domain-containing protein [Thermoactinomyces intermedius]MBA4836519.1 DUF423 domain-containing protein [Thermoactinomyces intermedius]MBH8593899.1 DUF423 domain-containing protein [Thermoactinomyces intermedius]MBH8599948.1 DUF423 domain-containing protein [Thermoactinomyces sp. CICC 23799]